MHHCLERRHARKSNSRAKGKDDFANSDICPSRTQFSRGIARITKSCSSYDHLTSFGRLGRGVERRGLCSMLLGFGLPIWLQDMLRCFGSQLGPNGRSPKLCLYRYTTLVINKKYFMGLSR